jgi:hypothetical protein
VRRKSENPGTWRRALSRTSAGAATNSVADRVETEAAISAIGMAARVAVTTTCSSRREGMSVMVSRGSRFQVLVATANPEARTVIVAGGAMSGISNVPAAELRSVVVRAGVVTVISAPEILAPAVSTIVPRRFWAAAAPAQNPNKTAKRRVEGAPSCATRERSGAGISSHSGFSLLMSRNDVTRLAVTQYNSGFLGRIFRSVPVFRHGSLDAARLLRL